MALPPGAHVLARSDFAPYAALDYGRTPAISFQCHPEFNADYSAALYTIRKGRPLSETAVDMAIQSLEEPLDNQRLGAWIARFISTRR